MGLFSRIFGKKESQMSDTLDRYKIESDLLPHLILENNGISVATNIMDEKGKFFVKLFSSLNTEHHCIYSANDFSVKNFKVDTNHYILEITMPKPEISPLCEKLILAVDFSIRAIRYLTVEKGDVGRSFLCEWKIDRSNGGKTHLNYGEFSKTKLIKILEWQ